jgi:hypothetical protein
MQPEGAQLNYTERHPTQLERTRTQKKKLWKKISYNTNPISFCFSLKMKQGLMGASCEED